MKKELKDKIKQIKLLILDVDGVMTNSTINIDDQGNETKMFNVQDGFGIVLFHQAGLKTAIISARESKAVKFRAKDLKISKVFLNARPKIDAYQKIKKDLNLTDSEICFMGDDLPDLCLLQTVGVPITVPNAVREVRKAADYVTRVSGGQGAVREVIELILKAQGKWNDIVKAYSK